MKLTFLGVAALMALAAPALAQTIPPPPFVTNPALAPKPGVALRPVVTQQIPPPPFVTNPALAPPPGVALRPLSKKEQAAAMRRQHREARQQERAMRHQHGAAQQGQAHAIANACHAKADEQDLRGKARRRFVARCRTQR